MPAYAVCPNCRTYVRTEPSGEMVPADQDASMRVGEQSVVCETCGTREAIEPWLSAWRAAGAPYIDDPRSA
jgi:hypothetical protein